MKLSANKAHKLAHISKKTLLQALEDGTLSGEKNSKGHWLIDQSELLRVFPENRLGLSPSQPKTPNENTAKTYESNALEVELNAVRAQLDMKDEIISDLRDDRDEWRKQAQHLALPKPSNENTPTAGQGKRPNIAVRAWNFVMGG